MTTNAPKGTAMRTRGIASVSLSRKAYIFIDTHPNGFMGHAYGNRGASNAKTWALGHNAANEIDGFGFNGDGALGGLPTLIANMQTVSPEEALGVYQAWEAEFVIKRPASTENYND